MSISSIFSDQDILDLRSSRSLLLVSGGRDSVFLLHVFVELREKFPDVSFEVLHFNHNLRGAESDLDQEFVEKLCARFGVICHAESLRFSSKSDLQNAARRKRREKAHIKAIQIQAKRIVMAHHADDQLETLVMKMQRGAGIKGLCGMRRHSHSRKSSDCAEIFRPMLHLHRDTIDDFFATTGEKFREDESNQSGDYLRNQVRRKISQFWTDVKSKHEVIENADQLQVYVDYFQRRLQMLLQVHAGSMPRRVWDNLSDELQFMWLRVLVARCGFQQQFERKHYESFCRGERCAMDLGACRLMRDQSIVRVCSQLSLDFIRSYQRKIFGSGSWFIGVFGMKLSLSSERTLRCNGRLVDVSNLEFPLQLRVPRRGDQFIPKGKSSQRKLGEYFQVRGIGRYERQFRPILIDSKGQILVID